MQQPVRHEERPAVDRAAAGEVGCAAARLLDEHHRRGRIPRRQINLDHRLVRTLGEPRTPPELAESSLAPDTSEEAADPGSTTGRLDVATRPEETLGLGEGPSEP